MSSRTVDMLGIQRGTPVFAIDNVPASIPFKKAAIISMDCRVI
jgi:hypothetical protein